MHRHFMILTCSLLLSVAASAESEQPVIEIKADRTFIYPQQMELSGEESLMDVLLMVPACVSFRWPRCAFILKEQEYY